MMRNELQKMVTINGVADILLSNLSDDSLVDADVADCTDIGGCFNVINGSRYRKGQSRRQRKNIAVSIIKRIYSKISTKNTPFSQKERITSKEERNIRTNKILT